ncbi:MAG: hypothetical protein LPK46_12190 [Bacteroidota bacterium]|nr:hypothetical protein [Bacteroidota bacterium]MDX5506887.1 hypothetical protein [Bacteroidota bacterium]
MTRLLLFAFFLFSLHAFGQRESPRPLVMDQLFMDLEVSPDTSSGIVTGKVKIAIKGIQDETDSLWLDGIKMEVKELSLDGHKTRFKVYPDGIHIKIRKKALAKDEVDTLRVEYSCQPRKGIYFTGWGTGEPDARRQIWTQGQGIDHRHWIPHVDAQNDKMIIRLHISFDSRYEVVGNWEDREVKEENGIRHYTFSMRRPMSSYLIMLAIGKYASREETSGTGRSLTNYYYPDWEGTYSYTYFKNRELFDFFSQQIPVPYPWERYSQVPVKDFLHGAMENTTATIYGDFLSNDAYNFHDRAYLGVNAHELAHQWFGNLVTSTCAKHHWLHESFATYYQWMAIRKFLGETEYLLEREMAIQNLTQLVLTDREPKPIMDPEAGSLRFYQKGALVLEMMNDLLGDAKFKKALLQYLERGSYGLAETPDLQREMEGQYLAPLDWFFHQWLEQPGMPMVSVTEDRIGDSLRLDFNQRVLTYGKADLFRLPLRIEWKLRSGEIQFEDLWMGDSLAAFVIPQHADSIRYWTVDPSGLLLMALQESKDSAKWVNQAFEGRKTYSRVRAIREIGNAGYPYSLLIHFLENDPSLFAQMQALDYLMEGEYPQVEAVRTALKGPLLLRKRVAENLENIPAELEPDLKMLLTDSSYSAAEKALARLGFTFQENAPGYYAMTRSMVTPRSASLGLTRQLLAAMVMKDRDAIDSVVAYTGAKYDFIVRVPAIEWLAGINYCNDQLIDNLVQGAFYFHRQVRNKSRDALKVFAKDEDYRQLISDYIEKNKDDLHPMQIAYLRTLLKSE